MKFINIFSRTGYKEEICLDLEHCHRTHIQRLYSVVYKDHLVEITQDWNIYHVRIDNGFPSVEMEKREMVEWVEEQLKDV